MYIPHTITRLACVFLLDILWVWVQACICINNACTDTFGHLTQSFQIGSALCLDDISDTRTFCYTNPEVYLLLNFLTSVYNICIDLYGGASIAHFPEQ